jgi:hypothetical protein
MNIALETTKAREEIEQDFVFAKECADCFIEEKDTTIRETARETESEPAGKPSSQDRTGMPRGSPR